ncbi:MAG: META domain-containing protein [Muribaculaceae bacterium]|nr:META domain-containing protein [Muribaculaceae bacterium]MDE6135100.1 META domain-containing protein [Muribaculaceae bacterium]
MKTRIKISLMALSAVAIASCTGKNSNSSGEAQPQATSAQAFIKGQWDLEKIVFSDSDYVCPGEEVPGAGQYITFEDSAYFIRTNCNSLSGFYTVNGDSITLYDGIMTEMACDNMATEDALRRILPSITTICAENDTIVRLGGSNPSEYIVLKKVQAKQ